MKDKYLFLKLIGDVDDSIIYQAGQPWKKKDYFYEKIIICVLVAFLITGSCVLHTEVDAAVEKFTTMIGQLLGIEDDLSSYSEVLDKSITKKGITLTLKEVILDQDEIYFSVSESCDKKVEPDITGKLWVNGQRVLTETKNKSDALVDFPGYHFVFGYRFGDEQKIEENADIKIIFTEHQEEYEYHFQASSEELSKNTLNILLDETITIGTESEITLTNFKTNVMESSILGKCENLPSGQEYLLKGRDNCGNEVNYRLVTYTSPNIVFIKESGTISPNAIELSLQLYQNDTGIDVNENAEYLTDDMSFDQDFLSDTIEIDETSEKKVGQPFTVKIK